jgi:hypothetical protein
MPTPSRPPVPGVSARTAAKHALEAGADRPHRLVRVLLLLDLDHAGEVLQLEGAAEIVEVVHGEGRVFGGELDVVVILGVADQLDEGRPARQDVGADRRLPGVQLLAQAIGAHGRLLRQSRPPAASVVRPSRARNRGACAGDFPPEDFP